ncbi:MAG: hypothetical protein J7J77_00220 [Candidatus Cloacimonetes bacterium]|nr:hypothetical protein [Candidatus Cloacimonadota bacterium]
MFKTMFNPDLSGKKTLRKLVFLVLFTGLISYTYCFCEDSNNIKEYDEVPIAWINHTSDTGIRLLLNTKYEDENIYYQLIIIPHSDTVKTINEIIEREYIEYTKGNQPSVALGIAFFDKNNSYKHAYVIPFYCLYNTYQEDIGDFGRWVALFEEPFPDKKIYKDFQYIECSIFSMEK